MMATLGLSLGPGAVDSRRTCRRRCGKYPYTLCCLLRRPQRAAHQSSGAALRGGTAKSRRSLKGRVPRCVLSSVMRDDGTAVAFASRVGLCFDLPATPAYVSASSVSTASGEAGVRSTVPAPKSRHFRDQHFFVAVLSRGHGHAFIADSRRPALGTTALYPASNPTMSSAAPTRAAPRRIDRLS